MLIHFGFITEDNIEHAATANDTQAWGIVIWSNTSTIICSLSCSQFNRPLHSRPIDYVLLLHLNICALRVRTIYS